MLLLSVLASIVPAFAEEAPPAPEVEAMGERPSGGGGSGGNGKNKNKNKSGGGSTKGKKFDKTRIMGWSVQPYVEPGGGVQIGAGGATSIVAGADVGVLHTKKKWAGDLYVGGSYTTGDALNGYDVHLGDQTGTRQKYWGLAGGFEGFYNGYTDPAGKVELEPSVGVDIPVILTLGPKKYFAYGTVAPGFLLNQARQSRKLPDFIDELEWGAGVGVNTKYITVKAGFTQRITASGVINTPTITGSLDGF